MTGPVSNNAQVNAPATICLEILTMIQVPLGTIPPRLLDNLHRPTIANISAQTLYRSVSPNGSTKE
jgi:hypothetical protein